MTTIRLATIICAPIGRCFDLSRSIDLHLMSTQKTGERVVAGRKSGLILSGETVTWEAVHFCIKQRLTIKITEMRQPYYFVDEMIDGAFKSLRHEHHFSTNNDRTVMTDVFNYEAPYSVFGKIFNSIVLQRYMRKFLMERNAMIKSEAEGSNRMHFLK